MDLRARGSTVSDGFTPHSTGVETLTVFRLRALVFRTSRSNSTILPESDDTSVPDSPGASMKERMSRRSTKNWALVTIAGIVAIAGLEFYALSQGINGAALRAALISIGVLGGAGFGRVLI